MPYKNKTWRILPTLLLLSSFVYATPVWRFQSIPEVLPSTEFTDQFAGRQLSVATVVNNERHYIGY